MTKLFQQLAIFILFYNLSTWRFVATKQAISVPKNWITCSWINFVRLQSPKYNVYQLKLKLSCIVLIK